MARKIQSQSGRSGSGIKTFVGLLANAIFWLVMAFVLPVKAFLDQFPELVPFAPWAPMIFYGLALLGFIRAVRSLQRIAASRQRSAPSALGRPSGGSASPAGLRGAKPVAAPSHGLPAIVRKPTVQRMR
jgi:uncharacterized membrane protein